MLVKDFLELPSSYNYQLLAGEQALDQPITGVNILENPKALDWLTAGEMLITSGYAFKNSYAAQKKYLTKFKRINISAVCIKPQVYFKTIPQSMIDLCNELNLPLIQIPYDIPFSKILNTVMNLLTDSANSDSHLALEMNSLFLEWGLKGQGFDYIQTKLASLIENPVILLSSDWSVLATNQDSVFNHFLYSNQNLTYFDMAQIDQLPEGLGQINHPFTVTIGEQALVIKPIYFNNLTYGYIIVLINQRPLKKMDYMALDHSTATIALEISHQAETERVKNRVSRDFYRQLLTKAPDLKLLKSYNYDFNFELAYNSFVISLADLEPQGLTSNVQQKMDQDKLMRNFLQTSQLYFKQQHQDIHLFKQGNLFIGLFGNYFSLQEGPEKMRHVFSDYLQLMRNVYGEQLKLKIYLGSSQPVLKLKKSYDQALQMGEFIPQDAGQIYFVEDYYLENFLFHNISKTENQTFVDFYLADLIKFDSTNRSNLLLTLSTYLKNHLNLAATSRELFIHRNTLLYRLEKINQLLKSPIDQPGYALCLQLALTLYGQQRDLPSEK